MLLCTAALSDGFNERITHHKANVHIGLGLLLYKPYVVLLPLIGRLQRGSLLLR